MADPSNPQIDLTNNAPSPPRTSTSTQDLPPSYTASATSRPAPLIAADHTSDNKKHLLFACSGSVATIKAPLILQSLSQHPNLSIRVILTTSASKFLAGQSPEQPHWRTLLALPGVEAVYFDEDEWIHPWTRGAPILHIELRRWADILLIAPLSANTLAKMTSGLADNLLTSVLRAWDTSGQVEKRVGRKRVVVAPAMNTAMWLHPVTEKQMAVLTEEWGVNRPARRKGGGYGSGYGSGYGEGQGWVEVLRPKTSELACGDVGVGAMVGWEEVVRVVRGRLYLGEPRAVGG